MARLESEMLESAAYQRYGQPKRRKRPATTDDLYGDEKVSPSSSSSSLSEDEYMDEKDEEDDPDNEDSANEKNINKRTFR